MCVVGVPRAYNIARRNEPGVAFITVASLLDMQTFHPVFNPHLGPLSD